MAHVPAVSAAPSIAVLAPAWDPRACSTNGGGMALPETMNVWHVSCLTPTHRLGVTPTGRSMPVRGRAVPALRDSATAVPRAIVDGTQALSIPPSLEMMSKPEIKGSRRQPRRERQPERLDRASPGTGHASRKQAADEGIAQRDVRVGWHHWERSGPAGPADPSLAAGQVRILE